MEMKIDSPEQLQKFLSDTMQKHALEKSAIMEGYELNKAKLAKLESDYTALAKAYNDLVDENKKLKGEAKAENKPAPKKKRATKKGA
jgi:hypothetical protein